MKCNRRTSTVIAIALGLGCGGGGHGLPATSQPIAQTVGPDGAEITISAAGDPVLAGTTLLIPRGALTRSVAITVSRGDPQATGTATAAGPSVRFAPDGLTFAVPATLTLPYNPAQQPSGTTLAVAVTSGGTKSRITGQALSVDAAAKTVSTNIAHFSDYQVVADPKGGDGGIDGGHSDGGLDGGTDGGIYDGGFDAMQVDLP